VPKGKNKYTLAPIENPKQQSARQGSGMMLMPPPFPQMAAQPMMNP